jgi:hypothetical protein
LGIAGERKDRRNELVTRPSHLLKKLLTWMSKDSAVNAINLLRLTILFQNITKLGNSLCGLRRQCSSSDTDGGARYCQAKRHGAEIKFSRCEKAHLFFVSDSYTKKCR